MPMSASIRSSRASSRDAASRIRKCREIAAPRRAMGLLLISVSPILHRGCLAMTAAHGRLGFRFRRAQWGNAADAVVGLEIRAGRAGSILRSDEVWAKCDAGHRAGWWRGPSMQTEIM